MYFWILLFLVVVVIVLAAILYFLLAEASPITERPLYSEEEKKYFAAFSSTYFEARNKFREAAALANAELSSHKVCDDVNGTGEEMTIDIAILNAPNSNNKNKTKQGDVIIHMSGTHGIEGYAGSAIQIRALQNIANDNSSMAAASSSAGGLKKSGNNKSSSSSSSSYDPSRPTVIFVHAVNPFGMANFRRFNENNVDLNRNCLNTPEEWQSVLSRGRNQFGYERFKPLFHPSRLPTFAERLLIFGKIAYFLITVGFSKLKTTFVTGQYHDQTGLYYGGTKLERSWEILRDFLKPYCAAARRLVVIDVHSGLGPSGADTLMCDSKAQFKVASEIWPSGCLIDEPSDAGEDSASSGYTNAVGSSDLRALCFGTISRSFAASDAAKTPEISAQIANRRNNEPAEANFDLYMAVTQEFGTVPPIFVARGVLFENAAFNLSRNSPSHRMGQEMSRGAFYVESYAWKESVLRRGLERLDQTVEYLKKN